MYSDALFSNSCGASKIAYVARHFEDLQGLRYSPLWAAVLFLSVLREMGRLSQARFGEVYAGILVVFCAAWIPWIKRWYRLRYGTVLPSVRKSDEWKLYLLMAYLLFSVAVSVFHSLEAYRDSLLLWPILLFILPSALHLPPADRAVRFRFALYAVVMLSLLVVIACSPVLHLSVQAALAGTSGALLAVSLYDHWLLNHLLRSTHGSFL